MFFEQAEADITARLTTDLSSDPETDVDILPEIEENFNRPFKKRRVWVCYKKSTYQGPRIPHNIIQDEVMQFDITLIARVRRGTKGIYQLAQSVADSIIGYRPTNCQQIYLKDFQIEEFKDNLWYWTMTVECVTQVIEKFTEETGPPLTDLSFQSNV